MGVKGFYICQQFDCCCDDFFVCVGFGFFFCYFDVMLGMGQYFVIDILCYFGVWMVVFGQQCDGFVVDFGEIVGYCELCFGFVGCYYGYQIGVQVDDGWCMVGYCVKIVFGVGQVYFVYWDGYKVLFG